MRFRRRFKISVFILGLFFAASMAAAQDKNEMLPFRLCGDISDDAQRLKCFDKALAELEKTVVVRTERQKREFGLSQQQIEAQMAPDEKAVQKEPEVNSLVADVLRQYRTAHGKFVVILENGQIWEETDNSNFKLPNKPGLQVEISKGFFGNYKLKVLGMTGVAAVKRIK